MTPVMQAPRAGEKSEESAHNHAGRCDLAGRKWLWVMRAVGPLQLPLKSAPTPDRFMDQMCMIGLGCQERLIREELLWKARLADLMRLNVWRLMLATATFKIFLNFANIRTPRIHNKVKS